MELKPIKKIIIISIILSISCLLHGQKNEKIGWNKNDIISDVVNRIVQLSNPSSSKTIILTCLIDTKYRDVNYSEGTSFNGIALSDYKKDLTLIDSLNRSNKARRFLFFDFDTLPYHRSLIIFAHPYMQNDSCAAGCLNIYCEIGAPIEGWENLEVWKLLNQQVPSDSNGVKSFSREFLSIPVLIYLTNSKAILKKSIVTFIYKINYREAKVQFYRNYTF